MNGTNKPQNTRFKVKKPVKIQYASAKEVAAATKEIIWQHSEAFERLAKS
jgi:hypothetical protein